MTREEALNKLKTIKTPLSVENIVDILEEVGVLEFEEEKEEVVTIFKINNDGTSSYIWGDENRYGKQIGAQYGGLIFELWPEGLVLWVGGEIKWKSWVNSVPNLVVIEARKYVDDCRLKPYKNDFAFTIVGEHFKMLEKLLEYVEKKIGAG